MLLLLRRSPTQEVALRQLLAAQRTAGSPEYHHGLTPQQFGEQFGPAASDIATVEQWLEKQGFTVNDVSPGGLVIDFSGTAASVRQGLHTTMHRYRAEQPGGTMRQYWANATDPAIPAALAPVVAGVVSLNNFVSRPAIQVLGQGEGHVATVLDPSPELDFTYNGTNLHALVPGDFNTIYNISPVLAQGVNGNQETIAIVARSEITPSDVSDFRNLFQPGATGSLHVVPATANAPGILQDDGNEATLDAEWAGAAAPSATVDLVVADSSATTDGIVLSALYIVDHDLAPILTASYGLCEAQMTAAGNEFFNSLWEQAAAERITVLVSAGDNGAAGCDDPSAAAASNGLAVSGFASTPYDTAVGGTQFNEGSSTTSYWGANRTADYSSALSYIPELPWDEIGGGQAGTGISAGSGGASSVYARPYWQVAPGVAAISGGMRLVPDVAFNSSAGHDPYVICLGLSCQVAADGSFHFYVVGGTSASTPSFAGVMALVDQKSGSGKGQGLANPVLYRLASTSGVYHDVTSGSNDVPCVAGSPDCPTSGELGFNAVPGYDEATGLGSLNVANLVNDWSSIKFGVSQTALTLKPPANATVGQSIPLNISVTGGSSGPAPTGTVDLLAQFSDGSEQAVGSFALGSGGTLASSTAGLPGGTYTVVASYEGDANYGPSTSVPVNVTLAKITPTVTMEFYTSDPAKPVSSVFFGDPVVEQVVVSGPAGSAIATGSVTLTPIGQGFLPGSFSLDPTGSEAFSSTPYSAQTYQYTAAYAGDSSYNAATSAPVTLIVNPSPTTLSISAGDNATINVVLEAQSQTALDEFVQIYNGSSALVPVEVSGSQIDASTGMERAEGTFSLPELPGLLATITAKFSAPNFVASTSNVLTVPTPANPVFSPTQLTFPPEPYGQSSPTQTATLTNQGALSLALKPFSSTVPFTVSSDCPATLASGKSCTVTASFAPTPSSAPDPTVTVSFGVTGPDGDSLGGLGLQGTVQTFRLFGGGSTPTVTQGQSGTYNITLTPYGSFAAEVTLGCSNLPPFVACSFSPATLTPDGKNPATATLTVTTKAPPTSASFWGVGWPLDWRLLFALVALGAAVAGAMLTAKRRLRAAACSGGLTLALMLLAACGGSPSQVVVPPPPPPSNQGNATGWLSPSSVGFGNVGVGETSAAITAILYSTGSAPLQISGISFSSGNAADFHETNDCGSSVAQNATCKISVTFSPGQAAAEQTRLTIAASAPINNIDLSGTGVTSTPPGFYTITVTGTSPGEPAITTPAYLNVTAPAAAGGGRGVQERASPRRR